MNEGEGGSEVTAKGENGMSKWHSQTGDAPPVRENSEGTGIFGESASSRSDLVACRWRIKSPGSLVVYDFLALLQQLRRTLAPPLHVETQTSVSLVY